MTFDEDRFVLMDVEMGTQTGKIRGRVRVDTGPTRLSDLVPTAHELTSVIAARACRAEEKEGKEISCRSGCAACCRQMVPLSIPEAFFLADSVERMVPVRKAAVLGRFEAVHDRLAAENMIDGMLDMEVGADPHRALNIKYFQMKIDCPFLVDEACSVYEERPVACRDYIVTSPAHWCEDVFGHGVAKVPMPIPMSAPLAWMTADLTGEPPRLIPLVLAPRWAAENGDLRNREWPGLDLFKKFMEVLGGPPRPEVMPK